MRAKITEFLASGEVTTRTEWRERISVKSNSFGRLRRLQGYWGGSADGANWGAGRFFLKRQQLAQADKNLQRARDRAEASEIHARDRAEA